MNAFTLSFIAPLLLLLCLDSFLHTSFLSFSTPHSLFPSPDNTSCLQTHACMHTSTQIYIQITDRQTDKDRQRDRDREKDIERQTVIHFLSRSFDFAISFFLSFFRSSSSSSFSCHPSFLPSASLFLISSFSFVVFSFSMNTSMLEETNVFILRRKPTDRYTFHSSPSSSSSSW